MTRKQALSSDQLLLSQCTTVLVGAAAILLLAVVGWHTADIPSAHCCRFSISKQRSTDIVGGELCLGFQVIDAARYASVSYKPA